MRQLQEAPFLKHYEERGKTEIDVIQSLVTRTRLDSKLTRKKHCLNVVPLGVPLSIEKYFTAELNFFRA